MPNATAPRDPAVKTVMRAYTVDRYGTVTEHRDATPPSKCEPVAVPR